VVGQQLHGDDRQHRLQRVHRVGHFDGLKQEGPMLQWLRHFFLKIIGHFEPKLPMSREV
jgi:hypothetical protein